MFLYTFWAFFALLIITAIYLGWKIAKTDMRRRIIPDAYLFPLLIIGAILVTFFPSWPVNTGAAVIGMAFGYIMSAVVGLVFDRILQRRDPKSESPIGMGDIKLISVGGLWCGPTGLAIALVLACIFGAAWGFRKKEKFIPFAPFFVVAVFLSLITITFLI
ncbi:MAG: prepilin peptidase [Alphaproteobacteria bacterium]|nr:prepilin peptidase [Alphaproteobacteria bacterium]